MFLQSLYLLHNSPITQAHIVHSWTPIVRFRTQSQTTPVVTISKLKVWYMFCNVKEGKRKIT